MSIQAIAHATGLDRKTVLNFVRAPVFPEAAKRHRRSKLDPYKEHMDRRWHEGCQTGTQLLREIRAEGYGGSRTVAAEYVTKLRRQMRDAGEGGQVTGPMSTVRGKGVPLSAREASWLLVSSPEALQARQQQTLEQLLEACSEVDTAYRFSQEFVSLVRERQSDKLSTWMSEVRQSGIQELRSFTNGLHSDYRAVESAVSLDYSNGEMEGNINRLKLIKRSMYGRAKFELLRKRVLHAPPLLATWPSRSTTTYSRSH